MRVSSQIVLLGLLLDLKTIEELWSSLFDWLSANSKKVGMHPQKMQRLLVELFSKKQYTLNLSKCQIKRQ